MNTVIMHIVSGASFFSGASLISISILMTFKKTSNAIYNSTSRLIFILGFLLAVISSPSLNPVLETLFYLVPIVSMILSSIKSIPAKTVLTLKIIALAICAAGVIIESITWITPEIPKDSFSKVYILGDSVSAGIGFKGEKTWAEIVSDRTHLPIVNLSRGGGTVRSTISNIRYIKDDKALIFLPCTLR